MPVSRFAGGTVNTYRVLVKTAVLKPPGGVMLEVFLSDPVLAHGAIMLAANHWVTIGGLWNQIAASFYYHKVETIKLLRERMMVQNEAMSESTISAIATLILVECHLGFMDAATSHMKGLAQLVRVRSDSGLNGTPMNPLMNRLVMLADLQMSTATKTPPRFSPSAGEQEPTSGPSAQQVGSSVVEISGSILYQGLDTVRGLNDRTKKMFALLRHLSSNRPTQEVSNFPSSLSPPSSPLLVEFESLIFSIMHSVGPTDTASISATVTSACIGIAGTIYLHLFIKRTPRGDPVYTWQLHLLKESVQLMRSTQSGPSSSILGAESMWPEVWLWIYFVSGYSTVRREPAQDGARLLICRELMGVKQILGLGVGDWTRVQNMLGVLIWSDEDQGIGLELWEDVCQIVQP
ncbi:hypothetical protein B7463_g10791, partial [Scytalidium lignicola]